MNQHRPSENQELTGSLPDGLPPHQWHPSREHSLSCQKLAERIQQQLQSALKSRPRASMILSGGSTPALLLDILSHCDIDWPNIDISLADERWVDANSDQSNEQMIRQRLLTGPARAANFIALKGNESSAERGQAACEQRLNRLPIPFDVCLLGMGNDGHTASLFPQSPLLARALDPTSQQRSWPMRAPAEPSERISLGVAPLSSCQLLILLLQGSEKLRTLRKALLSDNAAEMPIRAFLKHPELQVFWSP